MVGIPGRQGRRRRLVDPHSARSACATILGDAFIPINATSHGRYLVLLKPPTRRCAAVMLISWCLLIGLALLAPFGIGELPAVE
jgi:hypothetical protein